MPLEDRSPSRLPEHVGRAALGTALAALALAAFGLLAGAVLRLPLLGTGALQVALGGSIAAGTLAAVAALASRGPAGVARSALRRRTVAAAAIAVALLLGLLALPSLRFAEAVRVAPETSAAPPGPDAERLLADAEGALLPIAVDAPPARAFRAARRAAVALGWEVTAADARALRFEAREAADAGEGGSVAVRVEAASGGAVVQLEPAPQGPRPAPARVRAFSERLRATLAAGS